LKLMNTDGKRERERDGKTYSKLYITTYKKKTITKSGLERH